MSTIIKRFGLMLMAALMPLAHADNHGVSVKPVTENIFMLVGKGGNIGVMTGPDGTFAIDDQYAPSTPEILKAIRSVDGDAPTFLINTHFHGDHTGGNENLGEQGALIMAHDKVRERLAEGYQIPTFKMTVAPGSKVSLPVVTFDHELGLHINGDHVRAYHVPNAHTDGDSFIKFMNANVIHTGDIFFNGFYPFIDVRHGGTLKGAIAGVDVILSHVDADTKIIPGHGPLANRADLERYRAMLTTAYERLAALKQSGKTLTQALAAKPLADLDDSWGKAMFNSDVWVGLIYEGLD
ncbi:MAG: MBL fold metallo-hydrolase [Candidatus Pelagadaptatus aseana]|uniref:MBL fold metallo-hydrolase n=1 Tax=Candidatus Pelagadaptatus aseana TaxID=3120508 RepID=UPI0039B2BB4D